MIYHFFSISYTNFYLIVIILMEKQIKNYFKIMLFLIFWYLLFFYSPPSTINLNCNIIWYNKKSKAKPVQSGYESIKKYPLEEDVNVTVAKSRLYLNIRGSISNASGSILVIQYWLFWLNFFVLNEMVTNLRSLSDFT